MNFLKVVKESKSALLAIISEGIEVADLSFFESLHKDLLEINSPGKSLQVFARALRKFTEAKKSERMQAFWELNSLIERFYVSLCSFPETSQKVIAQNVCESVEYKNVKYSEIKHLVAALASRNGSMLNLVRESIIRETYKSRQLVPYFVDCLDIRHSETAELIAKEVIPFFGRSIIKLTYQKIDFKYSVGQERIINVLLTSMNVGEKKGFVSELLLNGDTLLRKHILKTVEPEFINKRELAPLIDSRSVELRDLALGMVEKYT